MNTKKKNELQHHGILGQKWGVRRYQNKDGSLTVKGKKRYSSKDIGNSNTIKTSNNLKKAALVGATACGVVLAAYGAYKFNGYIKTKAAQDIINNGNEVADKIVREAETARITKAVGPTPAIRNLRGAIAANELHTKAIETRKAAVDKANEVSKSFFKSSEYLLKQKKEK